MIFRNVAELLLHGVLCAAQLVGVAEKGLPRKGQLQRNTPHNERTVQFPLQIGNVRRERLLRDVQELGGAGEAPLPCKDGEVFQ